MENKFFKLGYQVYENLKQDGDVLTIKNFKTKEISNINLSDFSSSMDYNILELLKTLLDSYSESHKHLIVDLYGNVAVSKVSRTTYTENLSKLETNEEKIIYYNDNIILLAQIESYIEDNDKEVVLLIDKHIKKLIINLHLHIREAYTDELYYILYSIKHIYENYENLIK